MSLLRTPVDLSLRVAGFAARKGLEAAEAVVGRVASRGGGSSAPAQQPARSAPTPAPSRPRTTPSRPRTTPSRPTNGASAASAPPATPEPAAPKAAPRTPPSPGRAPDPVVTETPEAQPDEVVFSSGPDRDAGAQIHIGAPFEGYDKLSAPDIVDRLRAADPATRAAVALYEGQGRKRKTVLAAARRED